MARSSSPYNKNNMGNFPQTIWQRLRFVINNDRGDTESVLNLIPAEKSERKPRPIRRGGNPGKNPVDTVKFVDRC
jgi:hypothetical protein